MVYNNIYTKSQVVNLINKFENGIISETDLSEEEKSMLIAYYKINIRNLREKIENKKAILYKRYISMKNRNKK